MIVFFTQVGLNQVVNQFQDLAVEVAPVAQKADHEIARKVDHEIARKVDRAEGQDQEAEVENHAQNQEVEVDLIDPAADPIAPEVDQVKTELSFC